MATGNGYVPSGTGSNWIAQVYAKQLDRLAYVKASLWNQILEQEPLKNALIISKHDNLTVSTIADTADMYEPAFTSNTETKLTVTPKTINLPVSVNLNMIERMMLDPRDTLRQSIELAMAQKVDTDVAALFPSLTTNAAGDSASDIDLARVLQARSLVKAGAKEYAQPGKYVFAYHDLQDDAVMGIGQFTQAYARGDKQNPQVGGVITEAYGIQFTPTSVISSSGSQFNNCMFIERAFVISFNQRPTVKLQDHGYAHWLLGWADYGVGTLRDQYACLVKSKPS